MVGVDHSRKRVHEHVEHNFLSLALGYKAAQIFELEIIDSIRMKLCYVGFISKKFTHKFLPISMNMVK